MLCKGNLSLLVPGLLGLRNAAFQLSPRENSKRFPSNCNVLLQLLSGLGSLA